MKQAALVYITGQSNAHAHGRALAAQDRIERPLNNVFALDRAQNQSLDVQELVWSGFTTCGKNLGESQDHTASLAYHLARRWQRAVDGGAPLPDLYIVQMSVGSQGIVNGMWNPDWPRGLTPGPLDTVNISLYPFARHVFPMVPGSIARRGAEVAATAWHWLGSEQEVWDGAYLRPDTGARYDAFFDAMLAAVGVGCDVYLYKLYIQEFCRTHGIPAEATDRVNELLVRQCHRHERFHFIAAEDSPCWDPGKPQLGIFAPDNGHYIAAVHQWFADRFFEEWTPRFAPAPGKERQI